MIDLQCMHDVSVIPTLTFCTGYYYRLASDEDMKAFLHQPESFVPPFAPYELPAELPVRRRKEEVQFPIQVELRGFCPVTFVHGKCAYESIIPGDANLVVEYKDRFYYCASAEKLEDFMKFVLL